MLNSKIFSLAEQALVSLLNFGSIFLISKYVSVEMFAEYTIAYSYVVFLFFLSTALFSSPVLIFYVKNWHDKGRAYLGSNIFLGTVIILVVCAFLYPFMQDQVSESSFMGFFLFCLGMFVYDLLRKFIYVLKKALLRILLGLSVLLNVVFFGLLFYYKDELSLTTIFYIYAVSFLGVSTVLFTILFFHKSFKSSTDVKSLLGFTTYRQVFKQHYVYAKWLIIGGLIFWGYTQGIYIAAEYFNYSLEEIAKTRLIQNFMGVFGILAITLENYYNPIFSSYQGHLMAKVNEVYRKQYKKIIILFVIAIPIGLIFFDMIYSDKYKNILFLFFLMIITQIIFIGTKPIVIALKSKELTKPLFFANLTAFVIAITSLLILKNTGLQERIGISFFLGFLVYGLMIFSFKKQIN